MSCIKSSRARGTEARWMPALRQALALCKRRTLLGAVALVPGRSQQG